MAWQIDSVHSQVTFSVKHMIVSTVKGTFNVIRGELEIDEQHPEHSRIEAEADAASVDTRDARRDGHLRSADFFDADTYPTITFKSTKVEARGDNDYRVVGDLTMHGITKEATFAVEYSGQIKDGYGMQRAGLSARTIINRKDFGLNWNTLLESGGVAVSDKVTIEIDLAAVRQPVAVA